MNSANVGNGGDVVSKTLYHSTTLWLNCAITRSNDTTDAESSPKYMVGRLQVLLQADRLHLPITTEAAVLVTELQDYQIDVNERAHASFNAPSGKHDDLVIALVLSVGAGKRYHGPASVTSWMAEYDEDDYRHPDHVPPWFGTIDCGDGIQAHGALSRDRGGGRAPDPRVWRE